MWEKIFSSTLGRVIGALALIILGFFGTVMLQFWHTNVASPEYVNQRINEQTEEVRVMLSLEDQEIRKELSQSKIQASENQGKLIAKLEDMKRSIDTSSQGNMIFQTQVSSDLKYLKEQVGDIKEVQKESNQRIRALESGN